MLPQISVLSVLMLAFLLSACGNSASVDGKVEHPKAEIPAPDETPQQKFASTLAKAEAGDLSAQVDLYLMLLRGEGTEKDDAKGLEWLMKAVDKDHPRAVYVYALRFGKEGKKQMELFEKAHNLGSLEATFDLAFYHRYGVQGKVSKDDAFKYAQLGADKNHPPAVDMLASLYEDGFGTYKSEIKALTLYQKAASLGESNSLYKVGVAYYTGDGLPKNFELAAENMKKAAILGYGKAQFYLGFFYDTGTGLERDNVLSYAWFNLASANPSIKHLPMPAEKLRDGLSLSPEERKEAQQLSSLWKKGDSIVRIGTTSPIQQRVVRYGTAFFVSEQGHAVTNNHVTDKCSNVRIKTSSLTGAVVASDKSNDLSLLKFDLQATKHARFGSSRDLNEGASVVVYGFPLSEVLPSSGNVTDGIVSSVSGLANNSSQFQITAPVQSGSSGSPVMDRKGRVIGIVSQKLSDAKVMNVTGNVAQNVGFSVKSDVILELLRQNKVPVSEKSFFDFFERSTESIVEDAKAWTFVVECVR